MPYNRSQRKCFIQSSYFEMSNTEEEMINFLTYHTFHSACQENFCSGIGLHTASKLAVSGATVLLHARFFDVKTSKG